MIVQCKICRKVLAYEDTIKGVCKPCARKRAQKNRLKNKADNDGLVDTYYNILKRCCDPSNASYARYGGRGITICDEWRNNRLAFIDWSRAHGHKPGLQIDRIDNDKGYSPDNCRWVTRAANQHNTSQTALSEKAVNMIRVNNITRRYTQTELARRLGVSQSRISDVTKNKTWKREK